MTPKIKEMIVLAAKAMGYSDLGGGAYWHHPTNGRRIHKSEFNPLTPADSHAMMCALEIDVIWLAEDVLAMGRTSILEVFRVSEPTTTDKSAACMMAILRVAAEMGKGANETHQRT